MPKIIDISGQRFCRLIVINRADNNHRGLVNWSCRCDCGREVVVLGYNLKSGHTQSCGCMRIKHGHSTKFKQSKTYKSWCDIVQRCTNPNNVAYHNYGGRGIKICDRWRNSFENFLKDMGKTSFGLQIERINNNKGYCKSNCYWATSVEQNRNSRNNNLETYNGKTQCIAAWAEEYRIAYKTLWARLYIYSWPIEKALTTSIKKSKTGEHLEHQYV